MREVLIYVIEFAVPDGYGVAIQNDARIAQARITHAGLGRESARKIAETSAQIIGRKPGASEPLLGSDRPQTPLLRDADSEVYARILTPCWKVWINE